MEKRKAAVVHRACMRKISWVIFPDQKIRPVSLRVQFLDISQLTTCSEGPLPLAWDLTFSQSAFAFLHLIKILMLT